MENDMTHDAAVTINGNRLTDDQENTLRNALSVAIDRFKGHVEEFEVAAAAEPEKQAWSRLADQFRRQITETQELMDLIINE